MQIEFAKFHNKLQENKIKQNKKSPKFNIYKRERIEGIYIELLYGYDILHKPKVLVYNMKTHRKYLYKTLNLYLV